MLSCYLSVLGFVSAAEIKGKVVSLNDMPIEGALVREPASQAQAETDSEGRFALIVSDAKSVRLVVVHPDYLGEEVRLSGSSLTQEVVVSMVP
jgi:hypothetical protein